MAERPAVACWSPFVPTEFVWAHGCRLVRPDDRPVLEHLAEGRCPAAVEAVAQAEAWLEAGHAGTVFTTCCDQMRRAAEVVASERVLLFDLPHTWQTATAHRRYRLELERLGRRLVEWGGRCPDTAAFADSLRLFDDARRELRARRATLTAAAYHAQVRAWQVEGSPVLPIRLGGTVLVEPGAPILLLGGPLLTRDAWLLAALADAGLRVAYDGTDLGERTLPRPFDRGRLAVEPLAELTDAYFGHIPDAFRRPNTLLYEWVDASLRTGAIRAVVLVYQLWCDLWRAEAGRLRDWLPVPLVAIDLVDDGGGRERARTRLGALAEAIT